MLLVYWIQFISWFFLSFYRYLIYSNQSTSAIVSVTVLEIIWIFFVVTCRTSIERVRKSTEIWTQNFIVLWECCLFRVNSVFRPRDIHTQITHDTTNTVANEYNNGLAASKATVAIRKILIAIHSIGSMSRLRKP